MLKITPRYQWLIAALLVVMLVATRGQHFASLHNLPSASWAVFFLAGVYLRPVWALPALLMLTWSMDFAAFTWGGASGFCLTPAYVALIPAYSALWFAGRWYATRHRFAWSTLLPLVAAMLGGAAVCELISSGSFYFFSGRFAEPTLGEFAGRLVTYFPSYLQTLAFYTGTAALTHGVLVLARDAASADDSSPRQG